MTYQTSEPNERLLTVLEEEQKEEQRKEAEAVELILSRLERSPRFAEVFFARVFPLVGKKPALAAADQGGANGSLSLKGLNAKTKGKASRALLALIRSLLPSLPNEFTFHEVIKKLPSEHAKWGEEKHRPALSTALRELAEAGDIERIEKGSGVIPNKYRIKR